MPRVHSLFILIVMQLAGWGCYSYRPVAPAAVRPGSTVRVTMNGEEALRQQGALGRLDQRIEGRVVTAGQDQLAITVPQSAGPAQSTALNTLVTLPQRSVLVIEEKRFSATKTALVAAGGAVAAAAVFAIVEASATSGDDEGPPTNARVRIPVLRLPIW